MRDSFSIVAILWPKPKAVWVRRNGRPQATSASGAQTTIYYGAAIHSLEDGALDLYFAPASLWELTGCRCAALTKQVAPQHVCLC